MNQRGIALLAGLVLLAALSLLAVVSVSGMILQRHMAGNYRENTLALENAAIASAHARAWLNSRADHERQAACQTGCVLPEGIHNPGLIPPSPEFTSLAWWRGAAVQAGIDPSTGAIAAAVPGGADNPPLWVAEEVHYRPTGDPPGSATASAIAYYRILGRGAGRGPGTVAVTESIVARPWGGSYEPGRYPPTGSPDEFCAQFPSAYDCGLLAWRQLR